MKLSGTVDIAAALRNVTSDGGGFMTKPDEDYGIPRRWITLLLRRPYGSFHHPCFRHRTQGTQGRRSSRAVCAGLARCVDNLAVGAEACQTETQPDW